MDPRRHITVLAGWRAITKSVSMRMQMNSGAQTDLGEDNPVSHGKNVQKGGDPDKPGQDQRNGMHTGVHLGITGSSGIKEERYRRRDHL